MGLKIYNGSTWSSQASAFKYYNGSVWVDVLRGYVFESSQWKQFWPEFPANTATPTVTYSYPIPYNSANIGGVGQTVSSSSGTWTNSGTITYQWQRAFWNNSSSFSNIPGATSSSYFLDTSNVAYSVRCAVTNTNSRGATTVYTATDSTLGPKYLTGATKSFLGGNKWFVSWNSSYGAASYYIQYQYVGSIPLTEVNTTATSYTIDASAYPTAPNVGVLINPCGPSSNGFPVAAYGFGYPGYGQNA